MDKNRVYQIKKQFDRILHSNQEAHIEFWYARDLMPLLGYERWENFDKAISRAMESCEGSGAIVPDHFREVTKMVTLGSGAKRNVRDYMLTRYACYLIAQNGDPKKEEIAFAQSYFAVQTRTTRDQARGTSTRRRHQKAGAPRKVANEKTSHSIRNTARSRQRGRIKKSEPYLLLRSSGSDFYFGAGDRTRTGTVSPPVDFESTTSTNSITPACSFSIRSIATKYTTPFPAWQAFFCRKFKNK